MENDKEDLIQINDKVYILTWDFLNGNINDYRYRVKNQKNQTVEMIISLYHKDEDKKTKYYAITLSVNKKGKGYEYGKQTGKSGIESLLIAKEILKYHIKNHLINFYSSKYWDHYIIIWWDDNRRRDIYYRGLKDLGFEFDYFSSKNWRSEKCLVKKIEKSNK